MIINNIGFDVKKGMQYETERKYNTVLEGFDVIFKKVSQNNYQEYLGWACWYYGEGSFPVIQCIWPDKKNLFPWDSGVESVVKLNQPILSQ